MRKDELSVIKKAIINELEGYEFYRMAAAQAHEEDVKSALKLLAEEEQKHIVWLDELFNKIKNDPSDDFQLASLEDMPSPGIFTWDALDRKHLGLAVSVFGIAIQMERASMEFYRKAAEVTKIPVAKELFTTLSKWEEVHMNLFAEEYDRLQGDWWSDQGYAPF